jgi:hypothetical protein
MRVRIILVNVLIFISLHAFCQSKKEVKANKIKTTTEYTTETIGGKEVTYKSQYDVFDKGGNTLEHTNFFSDGSVQKKVSAKFDAKGNKIEENETIVKEDKKPEDPKKGDVKNTKTVAKYNSNNNKIEEVVTDAVSGKQIKKIQSSYNSNGDKTIEVRFDGENKLIQKEIFTYDKKGLKIEHKTYDGVNNLVEGKKFVYTF